MRSASLFMLLAACLTTDASAARPDPSNASAGSTPSQAAAPARPVVGGAAAALEGHVRWLDSRPVPRFEPGNVYVIDLWATWCVTCIARMPHLSALASRHADEGLTVVGVAVMQEGAAMTPREFLRMKPGAMRYPVAEEIVNNEVPRLYQPAPGGFVPFMLIIDRGGRIAWMSSARDPFEGFEEALREILAGTWDLAAAAAADRRRVELEVAAEPLERAARERSMVGDAAGLRDIVDELIALDASLAGTWATVAYRLQAEDDLAAARRLAERWAQGSLSENAPALLDLARALVQASDEQARELAVWAARRSDEVKRGLDPDFTWALAKVEAAAGDAAAAVATMQRALATARAIEWDRSVVMMMERELAAFRRR